MQKMTRDKKKLKRRWEEGNILINNKRGSVKNKFLNKEAERSEE